MDKYVLPTQVEHHTQWAKVEHKDFVPNNNQQLVIDAVKAAIGSGLYYSAEIRSHVQIALAVSNDDAARNFKMAVEGGVLAMECYYAGKFIEASARRSALKSDYELLKPHHGLRLGTITFNDFKRLTGAIVECVREDVICITAKRGSLRVVLEANATQVKHAINRAHERNSRKDNFLDFTKQSKAKPLPAPLASAQDGFLF